MNLAETAEIAEERREGSDAGPASNSWRQPDVDPQGDPGGSPANVRFAFTVLSARDGYVERSHSPPEEAASAAWLCR